MTGKGQAFGVALAAAALVGVFVFAVRAVNSQTPAVDEAAFLIGDVSPHGGVSRSVMGDGTPVAAVGPVPIAFHLCNSSDPVNVHAALMWVIDRDGEPHYMPGGVLTLTMSGGCAVGQFHFPVGELGTLALGDAVVGRVTLTADRRETVVASTEAFRLEAGGEKLWPTLVAWP